MMNQMISDPTTYPKRLTRTSTPQNCSMLPKDQARSEGATAKPGGFPRTETNGLEGFERIGGDGLECFQFP